MDLEPLASTFASDPYDLNGLSMPDAKEYVNAYVLQKQQLESEINSLNEDLKTWTERVNFATSKNELVLAEKANGKVDAIKSGLFLMETELQQIAVDVDILKERLKNKSTEILPQVDADNLMQQMENTLGTTSDEIKLDSDFKQLDSINKLQAFKQKLMLKKTPPQ